jgi:hypothetical protein
MKTTTCGGHLPTADFFFQFKDAHLAKYAKHEDPLCIDNEVLDKFLEQKNPERRSRF